MAELACRASNCSYNKDKCCCKGDIMVGGQHAEAKDDTCCESFSQRRHDSFTSALEHPSRTISIDCDATKCTYNTNYKCYAPKVEIKGIGAGDSKETACATFKEA